MKIRSGSVLLLLFQASFAFLEARVLEEGSPLIRPAPESRIPPHEPDSSILREEAIQVDLALARDPRTTRLRLPLFEGTVPLDLSRKARKETRNGFVIWSGRVAGQPASTVVLSIGREVLIGNIATQPTKEQGANYYEIRYLGNRVHVLRQIDPYQLAADSDPAPSDLEEPRADAPRSADVRIIAAVHRNLDAPASPLKDRENAQAIVPAASRAALRQGPGGGDAVPTCASDPSSAIDALVVYTKRAREEASGTEAMELAIHGSIEEANISYENSGVAQRLRLVHVEEVVYDESGHPENDLHRLKNPGGALATVHGLRGTFGADLVALIVEYKKRDTDRTSCGNAYLMETVSNAFQSRAFAVVPRICDAPGKWALTHELGHLMGARHDWYEDGGVAVSPNKPFPYSHGYFHLPRVNDPGPAFRTLMSKTTGCQKQRCDRILFWSNPDILYPASGSPMGATGKEPSNNSQTLNNTAPTVANFRCHKD